MSTPMVWVAIVAAGTLTFVLRWAFIAMIDSVQMPAAVQRALRFVPAAVLSAIIWPAIMVRAGALDLSPDNLRLGAALVAALVAWRSRNILYTIVTGMAALWALNLFIGSG